MSKTIIGLNDAKAVKRWSAMLAVDVGRESYFTKKFMGKGESAKTPLQMLPHLENDAGDKISYDLSLQLTMQPIEGDETLANKEERLKFFTDEVRIDQLRGGVNTGGRMSRKRTLHDLREIAKRRQGEWWARVFDELFFMYLSGMRGTNSDYIFPTDYTGFASNSFTAPDTEHVLYGGDATAKANVDANDKFDLALIDRAVARASMMGGGVQETPQIQPIRIDGEEHFVIVMNPWQEYDLRTNTSTGQWLDIQKSATTAEGRSNPIFKGSLGMYNNVVLHTHKAVVRDNTYGAGGNVEAARALFMGVQAGVVAFGSSGNGLRFDWHEETQDRGNEAVITTSTICGVKKTTFNSKDFGLLSLDTAAADPS